MFPGTASSIGACFLKQLPVVIPGAHRPNNGRHYRFQWRIQDFLGRVSTQRRGCQPILLEKFMKMKEIGSRGAHYPAPLGSSYAFGD